MWSFCRQDSFTALLEKSVDDPAHFPHRAESPLAADGRRRDEFSHVVETRVRHFNGGLFKDTTRVPARPRGDRRAAGGRELSWTEVDPAIFGTLLEQALDKTERKKLGAHYTPRAYVQRLVEATVMEPLREDWQNALRKAEHAKETGDENGGDRHRARASTASSAPRGCSIPPAAPATFSTCRWS